MYIPQYNQNKIIEKKKLFKIYIMKFILASIQMNSDPKGKEASVKKACKLIKEAANKGAKVIVLPEVFNIPYSEFVGKPNDDKFLLAESIPGPTTDEIASLSKEHQIYVIVPLFEKTSENEYYDTSVLVGPKGTIVGTYRKTTIPGYPDVSCNWLNTNNKIVGESLERVYFKPGNDYPVFDTEYGKLGMLICWDRHFPENWRQLSTAGADVIMVPSAVPRNDLDTIEFVTRTRAFENSLYAVMPCRPNIEDGLEYTGSSMIVDPYGKVVNSAGVNEETIVLGEIDLDEVKKQIESAKNDFTKGMTETIDSEGELTEMLRGVDVVDKEKSQKSSAWPIPLNKNDESKDNITKNNEVENKINTAEEVKNKDKDSSTT